MGHLVDLATSLWKQKTSLRRPGRNRPPFFRPPSWCSFHRCYYYYYYYFHPRFREIENWSLERIEFFDQEKWLNFLRILSFVEEIWLSTLWHYEVKKHASYSSWRLITRFDKGFHISRKLIDKNNSSVDARINHAELHRFDDSTREKNSTSLTETFII